MEAGPALPHGVSGEPPSRQRPSAGVRNQRGNNRAAAVGTNTGTELRDADHVGVKNAVRRGGRRLRRTRDWRDVVRHPVRVIHSGLERHRRGRNARDLDADAAVRKMPKRNRRAARRGLRP